MQCGAPALFPKNKKVEQEYELKQPSSLWFCQTNCTVHSIPVYCMSPASERSWSMLRWPVLNFPEGQIFAVKCCTATVHDSNSIEFTDEMEISVSGGLIFFFFFETKVVV
jgi:hypothetical protein